MTALSRRQFLSRAGAAALLVRAGGAAAIAAETGIRLGYASITWGGNDRDAIADISALGYPGIQLRSNIVPEWIDKPRALADELAARNLTFVALSSGGVDIEKDPAAEIALHVKHARFLRACGGAYLQCTDARPARTLAPADYDRLGKLLAEIGRRTADIGVPLGYHNHMKAIGEKPEEVDRVLAAADPRYVKLELDIAHYQQGGGDPVAAVKRYADLLLFLHIKEVEKISPASTGGSDYRFVELGRGRVDVKGVFDALRGVGFRGWSVVELDAVPDKARTPKESAAMSKRYLTQHCGFGTVDFGPGGLR
jgi:inosose dehydratase